MLQRHTVLGAEVQAEALVQRLDDARERLQLLRADRRAACSRRVSPDEPAVPARSGLGWCAGCGRTPCRCSSGPRAAAHPGRRAAGGAGAGRRHRAFRGRGRRRSALGRGRHKGVRSRSVGRGSRPPRRGRARRSARAPVPAPRRDGPGPPWGRNTPARRPRRRPP